MNLLYYKCMPKSDLVIIGAGASGLMCAISAGNRSRSVMILDHAPGIGQKILVSGGGRCNFTNLSMQAENYVSDNRHFCRSALARFSPHDFISLLKKHRIDYHEKDDGQLFCRRSARQIVDMLKAECAAAGVEIHQRCSVSEITRPDRFTLKTNLGIITAESAVIATGGLSYTNLGATDFGFRIAAQFGINIIPPRPALVPLTFSSADLERFAGLSGVSFDAEVHCSGHTFTGKVLFTHKGLSGPAILQASSFWEPEGEIIIDILPGIDAQNMFLANHKSRVEIKTLLARHLPSRFAHRWAALHLPSKPLYQYNERELRTATRLVHQWILKPAGTEGYQKAEVTRGGIDTRELSSKTMEAKKVPGLYFVGEVVDVTGHLGGYNLHWAWASGWAAGQHA